MAILIGWISSCEYNLKPCKIEKIKRVDRKERFTFFKKTAIIVSFIFSIVAWKYYSFDSLIFQIEYKKLLKAKMSSKIPIGLAIKIPLCENLYTMQYRISLGKLLCDNYPKAPLLAEKSLEPFLFIEKQMPRFGTTILTRAVLYAKQGKRKLANKSFIEYAKINPFYPYLWVYWGFACKNGDADVNIMIREANKYMKKYPFDGAPFLGLAFTKILTGDRENAKKMFYQIIFWAKNKLKEGHNYRVIKIREEAEKYVNE
jgi:hypothetical protein